LHLKYRHACSDMRSAYCNHKFTYFSTYYAGHRYLHSFPTRRSSDLEAFHGERGAGDPQRKALEVLHAVELAGVKAPRRHRGAQRSEEHTSELQSRGHLVCRLLLEKKKAVLSGTQQY